MSDAAPMGPWFVLPLYTENNTRGNYLFLLTNAVWEHGCLQIQGFTVFLYQQPVSHLQPSQADICRL